MLKRGEKYKFTYTCSKLFFFFSVIFLLLTSFLKKSYLMSFNMLQMKSLDLEFSMFVDWVSLMFFSTLLMMVSSVLKFSCIYMQDDNFEVRFTWMVLSFVLSMSFLMFIPHFFFLLIGWDGLGMTSFLLVMYYLNDSAMAAGKKTYLMKRMGDSFFLMGLVLLLHKGHWKMMSVSKNNMLCIFMILGCFTKSAQFPFSSWLPAAMAAPTPVSSLVHSSTLVTAGIYVMMRFCNMLPNWLLLFMGICGIWTLYSASLAACCEFDGKKVVAYSTLSQLGLMTVAMSLKLPYLAFFHLMTHALFKALMFMCVGYFMYNSGHFQDLRSLKGMWSSNPMLSIVLMVSSLSLLGFPLLSGFFSKDLILEKNGLIMGMLFYMLLLLSLPLTSYYTCRLSFNMLKGNNFSSVSKKGESNMLLFSLLPLFMGSITGGFMLSTWFYSSANLYAGTISKMMLKVMVGSGIVLSWLDIKQKSVSLLIFFKSMCYLSPFNSSFWKKLTANFGSFLYYKLDEGLFAYIMNNLDNSMSITGNYFNNSMKYFLNPSPSYYVVKILGTMMFMSFLI